MLQLLLWLDYHPPICVERLQTISINLIIIYNFFHTFCVWLIFKIDKINEYNIKCINYKIKKSISDSEKNGFNDALETTD